MPPDFLLWLVVIVVLGPPALVLLVYLIALVCLILLEFIDAASP
jgi:hypothetical protein